jgi:hypothetical protein
MTLNSGRCAMPMTMSKLETGRFLTGETSTVTRMYPDGICPHQPGETVLLASRFVAGADGEKIIAKAVVTDVVQATLSDRRNNARLAIQEGFDDANAWYRHFQQMYGGEYPESTPVYRVQMRIEEMKK